jgi:hypothetical protein
MGAAVISLAEGRAQRQHAAFRRHVPEGVDYWLEAWEGRGKEPHPPLEQFPRAVWELRPERTGSLPEAWLGQRSRAQQAQRSAPCPQGGRPVAARAVVSRTLETVVGDVGLNRPDFSCVPCGRGVVPPDAAPGGTPGREPFGLPQAPAKLTAEGPAGPTRPERARGRRPGRKQRRAGRAPWQGEWREAKGVRFSLVADGRIVPSLSWPPIQDEGELLTALRRGKEAGVIPADQVRLCVGAEGARGSWGRVKELCPAARESQDYYPCAPHVHALAPAQ